jgi:methionyl-tRNA formyltransferase
VKARARAAGVRVLQPLRLKDPSFTDALRALQADLGVVAAYGRILTDEVLAAPRLGLINVHASLLPKYRGAAPVHRAIIAGEQETGVTIMRVVKALDAGPMLRSARRPIGIDDTSDEVERDLARLGAELLVQAVDDIAADRAQETPQDDTAATYAHRLTKEDGIVDWTWPARRIHDQIRGLRPWPHAHAFVRGGRLILLRSSITSETAGTADPGTIVEASGDRLIVATGDAPLRLVQIQAEGKRPMLVRDFLAGHHLAVGDRFTTASGS